VPLHVRLLVIDDRPVEQRLRRSLCRHVLDGGGTKEKAKDLLKIFGLRLIPRAFFRAVTSNHVTEDSQYFSKEEMIYLLRS
jgi:hypothetical protein